MTLPVVFTPSAKEDLRSARDWYEKQSPGIGKQFLEDVLTATNRISGNPEQFAIIYRELRQCCTSRFPYVISYRVKPGRVEVLAVLHGHRDPKKWNDRSN